MVHMHLTVFSHYNVFQTPAERLKAKVKVLLDKTTPTETTPKLQPNPVQVLEIEAEEFAPQSFTSKRKNKTNQKVYSIIIIRSHTLCHTYHTLSYTGRC